MSALPPKTMYLTNKELLPAVRDSKELGKMSPRLAMMLKPPLARFDALVTSKDVFGS